MAPLNDSLGQDTLKIWDNPNIQCDPKINDLLRQQLLTNEKRDVTISGFRLQLYFGSGEKARTEAERIKTEFLSSYPDISVYLKFKSPDFIVRVGDFRSRSEALKMQKSLIYQYPNAFIVADDIEMPELIDTTKIN
jgi:hypothetical protein